MLNTILDAARRTAPGSGGGADSERQVRIIPVIMAGGFHLFPFRTQKLSLQAPMVLPGVPVGEWVVAGMIVALEKI